MTDLTKRLRERGTLRSDKLEAADKIEHLMLDLQTERAAVVALRAEVAGLREDAERYRWLRNKIYIEPDRCILRIWDVFLRDADGKLPIALDAAVDAARKAAS